MTHITRREWLARVFGAAIAAGIAPLVDLTDTTPAFWNQAPIKDLLQWRITFPDGTFFTFHGEVVAESLLEDGSVNLAIRPEGVPHLEVGPAPPVEVGPTPPVEVGRDPLLAKQVIVNRGDQVVGELLDISLPELSRKEFDSTTTECDIDEAVLGSMRRGTLTFNINKFKEDKTPGFAANAKLGKFPEAR